jgi:hypothetical protein
MLCLVRIFRESSEILLQLTFSPGYCWRVTRHTHCVGAGSHKSRRACLFGPEQLTAADAAVASEVWWYTCKCQGKWRDRATAPLSISHPQSFGAN